MFTLESLNECASTEIKGDSMKNLVFVRSQLINKWIAGALVLGLTLSTTALQALDKNPKAKLEAGFDRIEEVFWNTPTDEALTLAIREQSEEVEELVRDGLNALPALLEIITSNTPRYTETSKSIAIGVAAKIVSEDEVVTAWEEILKGTSGQKSSQNALEFILMSKIVNDNESKIIQKFLGNLGGKNAELQASSIRFFKNMILGFKSFGMQFSLKVRAGVANPFRAFVDDSRPQVRQDALIILAVAGDDSDFEFLTEKMLDLKYDYESRLSIPALLSNRDAGKAFEPLKKLLSSKDANKNKLPELLRVECVNSLSKCTTETIGGMIAVESEERVDELRELFTKIFTTNGTEYRFRFSALQALASPAFLTEDYLEKLLDLIATTLKDTSLPLGFVERVSKVFVETMIQSKDPEGLMKKLQKKAENEAAENALEPRQPKK